MGGERRFSKVVFEGFPVLIMAMLLFIMASSHEGKAEVRPVNIKVLGQIWGGTRSIAVDRKMLYVGTGPRVIAYEMGDLKGLKQIGRSMSFPDLVNDIAISGRYAYVALGGLQILEIPSLRRVGYHRAAGRAVGVALRGRYAYLLNEDDDPSRNGVQVLDVSSPSSPKSLGLHPIPGFPMYISAKGEYIYVTSRDKRSGGNEVRILSVSDPEKPKDVGLYMAPGVFVGISGNLGYAAGANGVLRILDMKSPFKPEMLGFCKLGKGFAIDVSTYGRYAYILAQDMDIHGVYELWIVDISNPRKPVPLSHQGMNGETADVAISGKYAYIAEWRRGIRIADISDPSSPKDLGFYRSGGGSARLTISGKYIYLADGEEGVKILDISDPKDPKEVWKYKAEGEGLHPSATAIAVSGRYLYVGEWMNGLRIFDISNPGAPKEVGFLDGLRMVVDVEVSGGYAYIAERENGLLIVDISNPREPKKICFWSSPGRIHGGPHATAKLRNYLYLADGLSGLRILDISNPNKPKEVGFRETKMNVVDVSISGGYLYVVENNFGPGSGLRIMDISNPISPKEVGSYRNRSFLLSPLMHMAFFDLPLGKKGIALTMGEYGLIILRVDKVGK